MEHTATIVSSFKAAIAAGNLTVTFPINYAKLGYQDKMAVQNCVVKYATTFSIGGFQTTYKGVNPVIRVRKWKENYKQQ